MYFILLRIAHSNFSFSAAATIYYYNIHVRTTHVLYYNIGGVKLYVILCRKRDGKDCREIERGANNIYNNYIIYYYIRRVSRIIICKTDTFDVIVWPVARREKKNNRLISLRRMRASV